MPQSERDDPLVGEVHLRFAAARLPARLYWPRTPRIRDEARGLCLVLVDRMEAADTLGRLLCRAGAVVLTIHCECPRRSGKSDPIAEATLGWAADHACELGADAARLVLAGERTGAGSAAWLALRARDLGWPRLIGQLLVAPRFAGAIPAEVEGAAPATILTAGDDDYDEGRRYASVLRAAHVRVDEIRYAGLLSDLSVQRSVIAACARALRCVGSDGRSSMTDDQMGPH